MIDASTLAGFQLAEELENQLQEEIRVRRLALAAINLAGSNYLGRVGCLEFLARVRQGLEELEVDEPGWVSPSLAARLERLKVAA